MTQATLNVTGAEFNSDLIERIKFLLNGNIKDFDFQIRIKTKESGQEMRQRIDESIENIERKSNLVEFSPEEYEELTQKLSQR
ncbi:MAG: hypothetical protein H7246_10245 [Phycisphaerae bacterium]|nr:hypothetical protein [Saprospiraceae bacterium]